MSQFYNNIRQKKAVSKAELKPVEDNKNTNEEDICIIFKQGCTR